MDQPNYLFGYVELLTSLAVTLLAVRSSRFWICFPLGLLGVFLLFDAALPTMFRGDDRELKYVFAAVGISLLVIGLLGRKRTIGPPLALFGVHLLVFTGLASAYELNWPASAIPAAGLVLLVIAAISPRLPWGPLLAVLGWFAICTGVGFFAGFF